MSVVTSTTDFTQDQLVLLKKGDPEAVAWFVDTYSPFVYRLALRIVRDPIDAEDILQETFLKVLQNIHSFEGRSKLSSWLYRIVVNEALLTLRKRKPYLELDTPASESEENDEPMEIIDWCCLPEEVLLSVESKKALEEVVQKLPDIYRLVFILRDIEQLSIKETADALGISEANVKIRLMRARMYLRQELSKFYGEKMIEAGLK
ncbi:MAG TPA: sigma-70 family RNA polymerase sigma factor [Anaerolineaceae bacterium]